MQTTQSRGFRTSADALDGRKPPRSAAFEGRKPPRAKPLEGRKAPDVLVA